MGTIELVDKSKTTVQIFAKLDTITSKNMMRCL